MQTEHLKTRGLQLDDKDILILQALQENGRLSIREVAARVNLSPTPTQERIRRLEKEGVIMHYGATLNPRKINKEVVVLCQVTLREHTKQAADEFRAHIVPLKEIVECYNIAGDYDYMLKIVTESIESYHIFLNHKLSEVPYIAQKNSIFVLDILKQSNQLL